MFQVVMHSRGTLKLAGVGVAAVLTALALFALPASAAGQVNVFVSGPKANEKLAAPSVPKARFSAKVESCVQSTTFDGRQVGLYASMRPFANSKRMQLRFRLMRRHVENTRFVSVEASGLNEWISVSPKASVAVRHMLISGIATDAVYRGRVDFRWRSSKGKWKHKMVKLTKNSCRQTVPPPDLVAADLQLLGTVGPVSNYQFTVSNNGGSEARSVMVQLYVGSKIVSTKLVESLMPGASASFQVGSDRCEATAEIAVNEDRKTRENNYLNNGRQITC